MMMVGRRGLAAAGPTLQSARKSQASQSVFFHGIRDRHIDLVDATESLLVEDQAVCGKAFIQVSDGGGADDG